MKKSWFYLKTERRWSAFQLISQESFRVKDLNETSYPCYMSMKFHETTMKIAKVDNIDVLVRVWGINKILYISLSCRSPKCSNI